MHFLRTLKWEMSVTLVITYSARSLGSGAVAGHQTQSEETGVPFRRQIFIPFVHNFEGAIVSTRLRENPSRKALTTT